MGPTTLSPFPPPLSQSEKLQPCAEGTTGWTKRERDQEEGAGMWGDGFGFGAMAAVADVRWEDVIIWPWKTTMVSHCLPHCHNSGGPYACKSICVNTPVCAHHLFLWAFVQQHVCVRAREIVEKQQQRQKRLKREKSRDWCTTEHQINLEDWWEGFMWEWIYTVWSVKDTEWELDIKLTEMKYIHLCQP